jgi:uncharacterized membrane protein
MIDGKVLALVTALCFGLNPVTLKLGFAKNGRPDVAVVIGLAIAVPVYLLLVPFAADGLRLEELTIPVIVLFIFGGLFGGGIGRRWLYVAIDKLGAAPATAIKNSAPVISTALAVLLLGDQVTLVQWVAVVAIVIGITLVTWKRGATRKQLLSVGVLAALGSAVSYGIRPLFLDSGLAIVDAPLTAALIGAIAALVYATVLTPRGDLRVGLSEPSLGYFVFSGLLQAVGFLALAFALNAGDVSVVYPVTATAPIFTLGFTALMLRGTERLSPQIVAGVMLVVLGVIAL